MNCNYIRITNIYRSLIISKDKIDYVYFDSNSYLEFRYYKNKKILIDIYNDDADRIFYNINKS